MTTSRLWLGRAGALALAITCVGGGVLIVQQMGLQVRRSFDAREHSRAFVLVAFTPMTGTAIWWALTRQSAGQEMIFLRTA